MDITTATGRKALTPRTEPYWRKEGTAYIGFRAGPDTWIGRVREDGKQAYQTFGSLDSYSEAAKRLKGWLETKAADKKAGVSVSNLTVRDACERYLEAILDKAGTEKHDRTLGMLERCLLGRSEAPRKPAIAPHPIAKTKLADLSRLAVQDFRKGLLTQRESLASREERATATRILATVKAVLNFAYNERLVGSDDSWRGIEGFGNVDAGPDAKGYLTPVQRRGLIDATGDEDVRGLMQGLALIGARPVELLRATARDFDQRTGKLTLWSLKGKDAEKRERTIPTKAIPGAYALFSRLAQGKLPAAPLFRATPHYFDHVQKAVEVSGLPAGTSAYSLRHSFISDAIAAGVPIHTIASICGTSVAMIEKTYGKLIESHVEEAFSRMAAV